MYYAHEIGRRLESDSIQPLRFHTQSLWKQLYRNVTSDNSRQLQNQKNLLFWSPLFRRGASTRVQTLLAHPKAAMMSFLYCTIRKSNNNASISVVNREDHFHFIRLLRSSWVRFIAKCVRVHIVFTYSIHQGRAFRQIIQQFILDGFSPLGRELFCPFSHQDLRLIAKLDFIIVQLSTFLSRFDTSYLSWSLFLLFIRTFSFSLYLPSLFSFDKEILTPVWYDSFWCQLVPEVEQVLVQRYIISITCQHFACLNEGILSCIEDLYDVHRARVTSYGLIQAGQIMLANLL